MDKCECPSPSFNIMPAVLTIAWIEPAFARLITAFSFPFSPFRFPIIIATARRALPQTQDSAP